MRREGDQMICTITEFALFLSKGVNSDVPLESKFRECDFAVLEEDDNDDLDVIRTGVTGWYGVKVVTDLGFNTDSMILVADYFGGGCAEFCSIWPDSGSYLYPADAIYEMVMSCLEKQEFVDEDTLLFVDMNRYVRGNGLPA